MTTKISQLVSSADELLRMEPEELAGALLEHLNSRFEDGQEEINYHGYFNKLWKSDEFPAKDRGEVIRALAEAWACLKSECLIARFPFEPVAPLFFITRRGRKLKDAEGLKAYRKSGVMPPAP